MTIVPDDLWPALLEELLAEQARICSYGIDPTWIQRDKCLPRYMHVLRVMAQGYRTDFSYDEMMRAKKQVVDRMRAVAKLSIIDRRWKFLDDQPVDHLVTEWDLTRVVFACGCCLLKFKQSEAYRPISGLCRQHRAMLTSGEAPRPLARIPDLRLVRRSLPSPCPSESVASPAGQ